MEPGMSVYPGPVFRGAYAVAHGDSFAISSKNPAGGLFIRLLVHHLPGRAGNGANSAGRGQ